MALLTHWPAVCSGTPLVPPPLSRCLHLCPGAPTPAPVRPLPSAGWEPCGHDLDLARLHVGSSPHLQTPGGGGTEWRARTLAGPGRMADSLWDRHHGMSFSKSHI